MAASARSASATSPSRLPGVMTREESSGLAWNAFMLPMTPIRGATTKRRTTMKMHAAVISEMTSDSCRMRRP
ncbi:hypothetical protein [Thermohalobaculum xanthum]|uniref:hypothetical protein n=1 Tax=Thermohalobaculum xanthum TaxID=2753746 RepID=UPI001F213462|nr:hypothetical protein [Thermohalobaculum xanthum]